MYDVARAASRCVVSSRRHCIAYRLRTCPQRVPYLRVREAHSGPKRCAIFSFPSSRERFRESFTRETYFLKNTKTNGTRLKARPSLISFFFFFLATDFSRVSSAAVRDLTRTSKPPRLRSFRNFVHFFFFFFFRAINSALDSRSSSGLSIRNSPDQLVFSEKSDFLVDGTTLQSYFWRFSTHFRANFHQSLTGNNQKTKSCSSETAWRGLDKNFNINVTCDKFRKTFLIRSRAARTQNFNNRRIFR